MDDCSQNPIKDVRYSPDMTIVVLQGEVNLHCSPQLHSNLVDESDKQPKRLVLNLSEVTYLDSSGVGTLVEIYRRIKKYQGKMILCGMNRRVRSVFEITKLDGFFTICDTEQQAAQA